MVVRSRVEYATDQVTVYRVPCPHRCVYCWAWNIPVLSSRIKRGRYDPVEEAKKYLKKKDRVIVVSFTNDPYPSVEEEKRLTRRVLEILCMSRNKVLVLTKNPRLAMRLDEDLFIECSNIWLGTTIVTLDSSWSRLIEPRAPDPLTRISELKILHGLGGKTWLSIEPIIPRVTYPLEIVEMTIEYIDFYVLGAYNYWEQISLPTKTTCFSTEYGRTCKEIDPNPASKEDLRKYYREHIPKTIEYLEKNNKSYHIKKELEKYLR